MKLSDFRVQIPLWNAVLMIFLMIFMYGVVYYTDIFFYRMDEFVQIIDGEVVTNWNIPALYAIIIGFVLITLFLIIYATRIIKHNNENPSQKIDALSLIKQAEFLEDDEMLQKVTERATKKVYILYTQAVPLLIMLMMFPLNRYFFITFGFLIIIAHNLIFYRDVYKYIKGTYKFSHQNKKAPQKRVTKKPVIITTVAVLLIISSLVTFRLFQIHQNQEENLAKFEACLNEGATAIYQTESLFSLSTVTCEKEDY
ncbi:hypothetical protein AJ85_04130 [Alkalihalobacillus alcalophilus ATCC 27647 = CGMCC 1.3604]|uniref:Uncharacterized protein n=1 Tax=Alkalihalobacillus alcalophilus ATCC 27647 = CGMCC 1.3604 TaxID=1218173 RepID=A0A094WNF3_ALKAL|nr:hypothetical protein [Alkalihalobacillus alcalophilus]KGA98366.1 hypothetical protein BALCAV_0204600 [Alkalihalobacillus alcalophilus ATCC 27647 = CGMCC 1.3604]MED1563665.1 hypothetical protein [Alkalihalobacillus alcalophilus]THG91632.1 hypothetical protein AJ85_04130 [Alkalihalobacillus alcalophilus ATCC 27647 = CGMCC 1.3604]